MVLVRLSTHAAIVAWTTGALIYVSFARALHCCVCAAIGDIAVCIIFNDVTIFADTVCKSRNTSAPKCVHANRRQRQRQT